MIVYLAAAWSRREEMKALAIELEQSVPGLVVNSRWIKEEPSSNRWFQQKKMKALREERAIQDQEDVAAADILVRFTDNLSSRTVPSYLATGSRMVEMGMALRGQQSVIVVGGIQPIFDYLPSVRHVKTINSLKRVLRQIKKSHKNGMRKDDAMLAWAAGFFDGEGCAHVCYMRGKYVYPQVSISQSGINGVEVLKKFQRAVGTGKIYGPKPPAKNQKLVRYIYEANGFEKTRSIGKLLKPYLGLVKRNQFSRVCQLYLNARR